MSVPKGGVVLGAPLLPQVNLLPPEIRASRTLRTVKRMLALVLVLVVALAALGYVTVTLQLTSAQEELEAEQAETQRLLAAQREFAEVPQVLERLDAARQARLLGTSTEILWGPYFTELFTTAPAGVSFTAFGAVGATPMVPPATLVSPLHAPRELTLTFAGNSLSVPDTAAWIEALESIPAFQDAWINTATTTAGDSGPWAEVVYYEITGSVEVTAEAYADRFAPESED